jgi:hypothetical protein
MITAVSLKPEQWIHRVIIMDDLRIGRIQQDPAIIDKGFNENIPGIYVCGDKRVK